MPFGRILIGLGLAMATAVLGYALYLTGLWFDLWQPLIRPRGVSSNARFVHVGEGSTWFECSVDSKRNVNPCRAWDSYGKLLADGDFQLVDESRAATVAELRPSMVGSRKADGLSREIYLFGPNGQLMGRLLRQVRGGVLLER